VGLPFGLRETSRTDSSLSLEISASVQTSGVYADAIVFRGSAIDINGDSREDSLRVPLRLTMHISHDPPYWAPTTITDSGAQYISSNPQQVIVSLPGGAMISHDQGKYWSKFYGPDNLHHIYQTCDAGYIYTAGVASSSVIFVWQGGPDWIAYPYCFGAGASEEDCVEGQSLKVSSRGLLAGVVLKDLYDRFGDYLSWVLDTSQDAGNTWQTVTGRPTTWLDLHTCGMLLDFDSLKM